MKHFFYLTLLSSPVPQPIPNLESMDLATSIRDATAALDLFLNNRYGEAKAALKPW